MKKDIDIDIDKYIKYNNKIKNKLYDYSNIFELSDKLYTNNKIKDKYIYDIYEKYYDKYSIIRNKYYNLLTFLNNNNIDYDNIDIHNNIYYYSKSIDSFTNVYSFLDVNDIEKFLLNNNDYNYESFDVIGKIKNFGKGVVDKGKDLVDKGKDLVDPNKLLEKALEAFDFKKLIPQELRNIGNIISKTFGSITDIFNKILNFYKKFKNKFKELLPKIKNIIKKIFDNIKKILKYIKNKIIPYIKLFIKYSIKFIKFVVKNIKIFYENIQSTYVGFFLIIFLLSFILQIYVKSITGLEQPIPNYVMIILSVIISIFLVIKKKII